MRKVTIAALAILGLQLCEIVVLGPSPAGSLTGVGLETAAAALAAVMCFRASRRAQGMARPFWVLVGIGIATQCFTNILYGYYEASGHLIRAANIVLPIAILSRAFFFAMALFLDPHKDSSRVDAEVLIDYAQLAIVFSLVFLYFGYVPSNSSLFWTPPIARAVQAILVERGALVLLAVVQLTRARHLPLKTLYRGLLAYLSWYLVGEGAAVYLYAAHGVRSGTALDLAWTLPALAVAVWAARWQPAAAGMTPSRARPTTVADLLLTNFTFASAPLIVLLQVTQVSPHFPLLSYSLLGGSILCFAARLGLSEYRLSANADELRSSEERFERAFQANPNPMVITVLESERCLEVNEAYLNVLGYAREEIVGTMTQEVNVWADPEECRLAREELARSGRLRSFRATFRTKPGQIRQVEISADPIQLQGQSCLLSITRDMTEQNLLQEQLLQAQKMEALGQLAGGIAHDFNNLLGVILGYGELLARNLASAPALSKKAEAIVVACERAASLTNQLLAFSRRQALQPEVLNLNFVVAETEQMLRRLLNENIQASVRLDPNLGMVKADLGQIAQVLMNLAVNARDAMVAGGRLTIETKNVDIEEGAGVPGAAVRPGRYVVITVTDTGQGMDAKTKARIFEPFFTTKPSGQGTGLGLATVYGIVERSGGHILVDSAVGRGTTFQIYLPRTEDAAAAAVIRDTLTQIPYGSETILLVEDEDAVRELVAESLRAGGYEVLAASDGVEAVHIAEQYTRPIHLLITDVMMPEMSGPELVRWLATRRPETKVLYMTGYSDDRLANLPSPQSGVGLIQKPFRLHELALKMGDLLSVDRAQSERRPPAPERVQSPEPIKRIQ